MSEERRSLDIPRRVPIIGKLLSSGKANTEPNTRAGSATRTTAVVGGLSLPMAPKDLPRRPSPLQSMRDGDSPQRSFNNSQVDGPSGTLAPVGREIRFADELPVPRGGSSVISSRRVSDETDSVPDPRDRG